MQLTVTTTTATAKMIGNAVIVQNLGADVVYLSYNPAVTAADGLKLAAFDAVTIPAETSGRLYLVSEGTSDVRLLGAGPV